MAGNGLIHTMYTGGKGGGGSDQIMQQFNCAPKSVVDIFYGGNGFGNQETQLIQNICSPATVVDIYYGGNGFGNQEIQLIQNICSPYPVVDIFYGGNGFGNTETQLIQNSCSPDQIAAIFYGGTGNGLAHQKAIQTDCMSVITSGLVLNLDAANPASYSGSGTTWTDISSSGNIGTFVGNPTYNSSNGGSINFSGTNGNNDYVSVANTASLDLTTAGTLSIWINPNSLTQLGITNLIGKTTGGDSGNQSYYLYWIGGEIKGIIQNSGTYNSISTPIPTALGWYNYVFTWGNGYLNLYKNGVLVSTPVSKTINAQSLNTTVNIGGYIFGGAGLNNNTFNGKIPIVNIYNRDLSSTEVLFNFNLIKSRFGL